MAKLFKRGSIWYAWVRKRGGGVRKVSTLCTDKRAAEAVLAQLEREAADPTYAASKTTTQELLDEYTRSRVRIGRSDETLRYVRVKAGTLLRLLPKRAAEILHARMLRYVDARLKEGAMRTTIRKELGLLKAALKLAKKNGAWQGDPDAVIPELDDDYEPRSRALTPWELVGLCSVLPPHRAGHVAFIVATGARWGESERVRWDDLDGQSHRVLLRGTKTKLAHRVVPLGEVGWSLILWAWDRRHAVSRGNRFEMFEDWLNVRRDLAVACKRLGIPPVTPNDLRRTFGTWLREQGVEPQLIGAAMGHADSRMVERVYGRLTPEALGRLLEERTGRDGEAKDGGAGDGSGVNRAATRVPLVHGAVSVWQGPHPDEDDRGAASTGSEPQRPARLGEEAGGVHAGQDVGARAQEVAQLAGMHMGGVRDLSGTLHAIHAESEGLISQQNAVRRPGVEPGTRGFSGPASLFDETSAAKASDGARAVAEAYCWAIGGR